MKVDEPYKNQAVYFKQKYIGLISFFEQAVDYC